MMIFISVALSSIVGPLIGIAGTLINISILQFLGYDLVNFIIPFSIFIALITILSSAISYAGNRIIRIKEPLLLGVPMLFSSFYASGLTAELGSFSINLIVSIYLLFSALRLLFFRKVSFKFIGHISPFFLVLIGLVLGFFFGLIGIAGGSVITPLFLLSGFDIKISVASGLFTALFPAIGGTIGHFKYIHIPLYQLALFGIEAYIGAKLGAHILKIWKHNRVLEVIVAFFFIFIALKRVF